MTTSPEDLATRSIAGEAIALRELCERIQGPVYRLAMRMLGHATDAEDATQEIVIKAITHLATFEARSALMTWIYTIAVRHLLRVKARAKESAMSVEALAAKLDAGMAAQVAMLSAVEKPVLERELQLECTHGMFLVLSRPERIAYILAEVLGATDRIGAEICEIEPATFRQRLARARAEMRPLLAERCGLADPNNPCRCEKQAPAAFAAKLIDPQRLRYAKLATERDDELARADEQLGVLRHMGKVFESSFAAPPEMWAKIAAACPELTR